MIAAMWCLTIVATVAVIMIGIYMCLRISDDYAIEARDLRRQNAEFAKTIDDLRFKNVKLERDLQREKDKIHRADQPE